MKKLKPLYTVGRDAVTMGNSMEASKRINRTTILSNNHTFGYLLKRIEILSPRDISILYLIQHYIKM